jgi:glycosyltransferase involved in cell wall biosynthesis
MKHKKRLLFVGPCKFFFRSFMQWDLDALRSEFDVRLINACFNVHDARGTLTTPYSLIRGVAWADAVFCWFAGREAFWAVGLSQLYQKKTAVVVGGEDVTMIPEIGYGATLDRVKGVYTTFVLNKATELLPFSIDAEQRALTFVDNTKRVKLIHLGVDAQRFRPAGTKKNQALTVGIVNRTNVKRKGLETFVRAAAYLPDTEFIVVGKFADDAITYLRSIASSNVRFMGALSETRLIRCYQRSKVYVQASAHEAFGVSLAEGMACECVPVVTNMGAIPEVVADTGIYVPYGDPAATAEGIKGALESDKGKTARKRIEGKFSVVRRNEALVRAIGSLLN